MFFLSIVWPGLITVTDNQALFREALRYHPASRSFPKMQLVVNVPLIDLPWILLQIYIIGQWFYFSRYDPSGMVADMLFDLITGIRMVDNSSIQNAKAGHWQIYPTPFTAAPILHNYVVLCEKAMVLFAAPYSFRRPSDFHWLMGHSGKV